MKQITPHVFQMSLGAVNVFLIKDEGGLTLIDAGYPGNAEKIFAAIKKGGEDAVRIKRIILTHCHPDHAGSAAEIARRLGVPVLAHETDATMIEEGKAKRGPLSITPGIKHWLVYNLFIKTSPPTYEPVTIAQKLKDGDLLPIAGGLEVIHTPGHSAGHIVLLLKEDSLLIAADACSSIGGLDYSTVHEDRETARKSILKAAAFQFENAVFGHGNAVKGAANKKMLKKFS